MELQKREKSGLHLEPIGVIHSCFKEKFGIPRQPGLVKHSTATIELFPPFNREEMVRGLEGFSHIQVLFLFHRAVAEGWRPTVRAPRLGGKKRVGVFACRSPHRPNHIGLSAVRLGGIKITGGVCLNVSGVDFLDETPVLDIKPYVPYSDSIQDASEGFTGTADVGGGEARMIFFSGQAAAFCSDYEEGNGRPLHLLITEMLKHDPSPRSQRERKTEFGMLLWDVNIRWRMEEGRVVVERIEPVV
ncbi:tRNA (N6-threonylcarbamoyladenosine(37)-N6)-methyltransferase TrmO [Desulforhopalus vacuolatus]|nr:tRNA (N6-threonylcarbamoyladenosine(37)-N6)-methyltransferase TrmO [Desulforhopalus vacuolatus]